MALQAASQASHASAHMAHVALVSACMRHSVMQAAHIAMQASSIAIMAVRSMPAGRIIIRIIVMQTSAHIAQREAQVPMPSMPPMASEHIVHACMHMEQASIASCIVIMSMSMPSGMVMSLVNTVRIISVVVSITARAPGPRVPIGRPRRATTLDVDRAVLGG
jgi:hypothetical protein